MYIQKCVTTENSVKVDVCGVKQQYFKSILIKIIKKLNYFYTALNNILSAIADKYLCQFYINVTTNHNKFLFNKQPDASIIQIHFVTKFYIFRASSLPIIMSFLLYIRN